MNLVLDRLFAGTKNPFAVQSLRTAVEQKQSIVVTNLPKDLLLPAFFLATIAKEWKEPDVVDDYVLLRTIVEAEFNSEVPGFWHPDGYLASAVIFQGAELSGNFMAEALFNAYKILTGTFLENKKSPFAEKKKRKTKSLHERSGSLGSFSVL